MLFGSHKYQTAMTCKKPEYSVFDWYVAIREAENTGYDRNQRTAVIF